MAAVGIALTSSLPAHAEDGFGGALTLTSDYVYRGISQSRGKPAAQGDFHFATQGWSVGVWGSTVELNDWEGETVELNAYAGYRWQLSRDWHAKISAVHYDYPWNDDALRYDYDELVGGVGFRNTIFATVSWSFDAARYVPPTGYSQNSNKESISYEVAAALPLVKSVTVNLGAGYFDLPSSIEDGYLYWNAGLSYEWRTFRADLSYIGSDDNAEKLSYSTFGGDRLAAGLSWRF